MLDRRFELRGVVSMRIIFIGAIVASSIALVGSSPSVAGPAHRILKPVDHQGEEFAFTIYQVGFNYGGHRGYWSTYNIMNRCYGCGRRRR
jgi:hypothetical protein